MNNVNRISIHHFPVTYWVFERLKINGGQSILGKVDLNNPNSEYHTLRFNLPLILN